MMHAQVQGGTGPIVAAAAADQTPTTISDRTVPATSPRFTTHRLDGRSRRSRQHHPR